MAAEAKTIVAARQHEFAVRTVRIVASGALVFNDRPVPLQKLEFLAAVARSLGVPPRRAFSILVTIQPEGRNIWFGIREHAMGAILNGIAYDGWFLATGATS